MIPSREDVRVIEVPPSLTVEFAHALTDALSRAAVDSSVRLVVFVGQDPAVFSRGLDLQGVVDGHIPADAGLAAVATCLEALTSFAKPKLAVVRGQAIGGGMGLAAACDWVLATETSSFALPELLWGFVPAAIYPLIVRRIGPVRARAWALTAVARPAREALAAGMVDEVVPDGDIAVAARRAMKLFLRPDPAAIELLGRWSVESATLPTAEAIERGSAITAAWLSRSDVRKKLESFFSAGSDVVPWEATR